MLIYFTAPRADRLQRPEALSGAAGYPAVRRGAGTAAHARILTRRSSIYPPCNAQNRRRRCCFPNAKLVPVDGLKEMCFGSFEGRNYVEMEHDPDYLAWVAANCESPCPDGERKAEFSDAHLQGVCRRWWTRRWPTARTLLVILAHGGTQMAALATLRPAAQRTIMSWCGPNAGGYVLDARDWQTRHVLHLVKTVQYTKEPHMMIFWAVLGGFVLDADFRRSCVAAAPGRADGAVHHGAGKAPARRPAQNAAG